MAVPLDLFSSLWSRAGYRVISVPVGFAGARSTTYSRSFLATAGVSRLRTSGG